MECATGDNSLKQNLWQAPRISKQTWNYDIEATLKTKPSAHKMEGRKGRQPTQHVGHETRAGQETAGEGWGGRGRSCNATQQNEKLIKVSSVQHTSIFFSIKKFLQQTINNCSNSTHYAPILLKTDLLISNKSCYISNFF